MGLQSSISDLPTDSIPILILFLIATFVRHLHTLLHSLGLITRRLDDSDELEVPRGLASSPSPSRRARMLVLAEQLRNNRDFSFPYGGAAMDCVVCMYGLEDGDRVRMLPCRHVFHKHCFDGWLGSLNFTCPLCRAPLVLKERVDSAERRVHVTHRVTRHSES